LKEFGEAVISLSPRAQHALRRRIAAHLPDEHVVYNRLSPKELDRLFAKLLELADDAAASDAQAG
jgi:ABC-type Na+ transport system ATPase subunit NatA